MEPQNTRRSLLVVDDQESVRETLQFVLQCAGYDVVSTEGGERALVAAGDKSFDLALVDIHMPLMNGFEVLARLRTQTEQAGRPIRTWLMTGAGDGEMERRALQNGALGLLRKPFDLPKLLETLDIGYTAPVPQVVAPSDSPIIGATANPLGPLASWNLAQSDPGR